MPVPTYDKALTQRLTDIARECREDILTMLEKRGFTKKDLEVKCESLFGKHLVSTHRISPREPTHFNRPSEGEKKAISGLCDFRATSSQLGFYV